MEADKRDGHIGATGVLQCAQTSANKAKLYFLLKGNLPFPATINIIGR